MSKKQPGKKDNRKQQQQKSKNADNKSSSCCGRVLFLVLAVGFGAASYVVYNALFVPPSLPQIDFNAWWGPVPVDPEQDESVRPFKIEFSDVMVNDLKERLLHTRPFTPPLEDVGFQYGFNTNFLPKVLDFWKNKYNFKEREAFLNSFSQFKTKIQGLDIHYIHVKPKVTDGVKVVPLLMLHGWPGSVREFYELIPKLTTVRAGHKIVFELIVPSLPGYGFSQAATRPGLGATEVGVVMRNLMHRLGHLKFCVQGGDWGSLIGSSMATLFPDEVLGYHTNMPSSMGVKGLIVTMFGTLFPSLVVEPELWARMYPYGEHVARIAQETGYMHLQATKPDTVGVGLSDSPAGLAAYILEKFSTWTNPDYRKASDGQLLNKFTLTALIDNLMFYWTTNSITTSMRLYAETFNSRHFALKLDEIPTPVPTWGIKFKHELAFQPDSVLKLKYTNYLHSTNVEDGGHFAAFELPDVMADDIFNAVKTFIEFNQQKNSAKQPDEKQGYQPTNDNGPTTIYDFVVKDILGNDVKLERYKGRVTIIVNVASQCGLTETNYKQLNDLYEKYSQTKGLRILAFPCNQFYSQEPGDSREIFKFTKEKGVKFDLFEKVEVNGENAHPLWKFLKSSQGGTFSDAIKWNFSKFIIDKNGVPVERLGPNVNPVDMEPYLDKYW